MVQEPNVEVVTSLIPYMHSNHPLRGCPLDEQNLLSAELVHNRRKVPGVLRRTFLKERDKMRLKVI